MPRRTRKTTPPSGADSRGAAVGEQCSLRKYFYIKICVNKQCCGSKYIEFGSGSRVIVSILNEKIVEYFLVS